MAHEWKVGDRFTLEGIVVEPIRNGSGYAAFIGDAVNTMVSSSAMSRAKLIEPTALKPKKLDTDKPIRLKGGAETLYYIGKDRDGRIHYQWNDGTCGVAPEYELENIPEPKIKGRREAFLNSEGEIYLVSAWRENFPLDIRGRKWVEITEGEGMEES